MLTELHIQNFAIIDQLDIRFKPGLVTFTGETGAGKSIIVDAVETLLGGRAESMMVRSGAERAQVEGIFKIPDYSLEAVRAILEREQLLDENDDLALGREIRVEGRNIARVNGRVVNTGLLRELGEFLVDVHGQSEHLSLLRVNNHLGLLDRYATTQPDQKIEKLIEAYSKTYKQLDAVSKELQMLRQAEKNAAQMADTLNYQIREIEAARLNTDEEETLLEERTRLANAEGLANFSQDALRALDEGDPESPPAIDLFGQAIEAFAGLARLDPSQKQLYESAQSVFENMSELASDLRHYLDGIEFNPRRLDYVEERLVLIQTLKRKYGSSITEILDFADKAQKQLNEISNAEERLEALEIEEHALLEELGRRGQELSEARQAAAKNLNQEIETQLVDLNMEGARFMVAFHQQEKPPSDAESAAILPDGRRIIFYTTGIDKIEFLIAPNPGEGFKPLTKIASGGETSRLMLALKNVLALADQVPTLIFDEIDQGIGGRIGAVVGKKLWRLGKEHQVLCVTHLPQLAAFGDQHFHVEKQVHESRTITRVLPLDGEDRLVELAQMLGKLSDGTMQSARELLQAASEQTTARNAALPES